MNIKYKIAVLCNNRIAIPAIQALYDMGLLSAVGVPEGNTDIIDFCSVFTKQKSIPLLVLKKETAEVQLQKCIENNKIQYIFTMTFPWKISEKLLKQYSGNFYNFHYGLLPEMRGADPIFESIRQQCKETGITVHAIEKEVDRGAIILKKTIPLDNNITHGLLCTHLSYLGAKILIELITLLRIGTTSFSQDETIANYYKKPDISKVCINWNIQDAKSIQALARACNPWNKGAYTGWNDWNIRVVEATVTEKYSKQIHSSGIVLYLDKTEGLIVQCFENTQLRIDIVYADEIGFISGYRLLNFGIKKGDRFLSL